MTSRRAFIVTAATGLVLMPLAVGAQSERKIPHLGILSGGVPRSATLYQVLEQQLRDAGWIDGRTIAIEFRSADGQPDRLPALAAELVRSQVDVMLLGGAEALARAARQATTTIPTVIVAIDYDPIATGYVAGLARPGGNITGVFLRQLELSAKRLEILKEALPRVGRVAVLWDELGVDQLKAAESVARGLGVQLHPIEVKSPSYDFKAALDTAVKIRAGALLVVATPIIFRERARIEALALQSRLPTISPFRESAEAGGLLAYGADLESMFRSAGVYVDKILKGAKPADLPMEQPTKFDLVVNLKTAKALRVNIPGSLLQRADQILR